MGALFGVATLILRRRRATAVERAQLKWFLSASGLVVLLVAVIAIVPDEGASPVVDVVAGLIVIAGFWALPAAIVAGVLRYRLYDIDRLVSRSVSYGVVIALLAAVYAAGVFALPSLLPLHDSVVVAASTLAAAAMFNPLRRTVQQRVERRFDRPRFDREQELARFSRRLREQVDLDDVVTSLTAATRTTMHPTAVSVCIRRGR